MLQLALLTQGPQHTAIDPESRGGLGTPLRGAMEEGRVSRGGDVTAVADEKRERLKIFVAFSLKFSLKKAVKKKKLVFCVVSMFTQS